MAVMANTLEKEFPTKESCHFGVLNNLTSLPLHMFQGITFLLLSINPFLQ